MRWNKTLYTDPQIQDVKNVIRRLKSLAETDLKDFLFCICISTKTPFVLEVFRYAELCKEIYDSREYTIIGLAAEQKVALKIVAFVIEKNFHAEIGYAKIKENVLRETYYEH